MSLNPKSRRAIQPSWVLATLGLVSLSAALVLQFALPGLDPAALAVLPEAVRTAHAQTGKLIATIPLLVLGLGLISRDAIRNMNRQPRPQASAQPAKPKATIVYAPRVEEEVFAEEIADDIGGDFTPPPVPAASPSGATKIRARFNAPTADVPEAPPPAFRNPNAEGGSVALSTAKYLNNGKPDFRKGGTRASLD